MFFSTIKKSFPPRIQWHSQQKKQKTPFPNYPCVCRTPASAEPNANSSGAKSEPRNCASPFPFLGTGTFEVTRQDEGNTTVVAIFVWLGIYDILLFFKLGDKIQWHKKIVVGQQKLFNWENAEICWKGWLVRSKKVNLCCWKWKEFNRPLFGLLLGVSKVL